MAISLFFSPHQDDELLSMGVDIVNHIQAGDEVHVILCTDGRNSTVRKNLNDNTNCDTCHTKHNYNLSYETFIQSRDYEFNDSCWAMGVAKANVHKPSNRAIDGQLTNYKSKSKNYYQRFFEYVSKRKSKNNNTLWRVF
jgi:LmbE family N-acetylglucosaminyl deacetylase